MIGGGGVRRLWNRLGVGVVARGAPRGLGAGRGGARRDAGGGGGLANAGQRDRELREVVGAAHVGAPAGGDAVRDGGSGRHLLGFLLCSLPLPSSWLVPERALALRRCVCACTFEPNARLSAGSTVLRAMQSRLRVFSLTAVALARGV